MSKKILVTGSAGFIGFHVAKALLERGDGVVGLDNFNSYYDPNLKESRNRILQGYDKFALYRGNLEDDNFIRGMFSAADIDQVCHLAAQAGVRYSLENPRAYIDTNIVGFLNILEAMRRYSVVPLVYASSSSVYGANDKLPFSESDAVNTPISLYASTKRSNELMAYTYHHLFNVKATGLRFFTVYGPWARPDMALFKFTKAIIEGEKLNLYNHGNMARDFTYINDIVSGVLSSLDKSYDYEIFNLGNGQPEPLLGYVNEIENALGKKANINSMDIQAGDVKETAADISKAKQLLGYTPSTGIREGVPRFVEWYQEYYSV